MDTEELHDILVHAVNSEELKTWCLQHFREVYDNFADGMQKGTMVRHLIEHCEHRNERDKLVKLLREKRPGLFPGAPAPVAPPVPAPTSSASYNYDVFLSYAEGREGRFGAWTRDHFLKLFSIHLEGSLGRPPTIFSEREGMAEEGPWPVRFKHALIRSRCMVAIWSPSYFQSSWCRYEFHAMLEHERLLGLRTLEKPWGFILPVTISDGRYFPPEARALEDSIFDCRDFLRMSAAFEKTPRYFDFEERMVVWVDQVAETIDFRMRAHAPPLDEARLETLHVEVPGAFFSAFPLPELE
ncbi:MAG: TIR domain-containing protein [Chloroflexaceae bacterium]|nr:TIR domain-containing protein [Chloroflexaceae bacterium]